MPTEGLGSSEKQRETPGRIERLPEVTEQQVRHAAEQEAQRQQQSRTQPAVQPGEASVAQSQGRVAPAVQAIETVLEDGLAQAYAQLDEATQAVFKTEGEKAASKIVILLQSTKVQVRKIVQIIVRWLRILPSVSNLFIEQEAKIKTDRLLHLTRRKPGGEQ